MRDWLKRNKGVFLSVATVLVVVLLFVFVAPDVYANEEGRSAATKLGAWFLTVMANFVQLLASFVALLIINVLRWMQPILQYNDFIGHTTVKTGWEVMRNLANTGLIVVMLIVAFGTMFGVSKVSWQTQVPRIIIAAIAVNFSRLITGVFIDIGQVIMNAFVNAIQQVGYANFFEMLQIQNLQTLSQDPKALSTGPEAAILMSSIFALIQGLIALVVVGIIFVVLVYRIVVLWVVVIMSPAAFAAGAAQGMLSKAGGWYSDWWEKLSAAVMLGPILAFFLWLSLASTSGGGLTAGFDSELTEDVASSPIVNESAGLDNILTYVIGIALLLAGLEIASSTASSLGGAASNAVKGGAGFSKKLAAAPVAIAGGAAAYAARQGIKGGKATVRGGVDLAVDQTRGRTAEFRKYTRDRIGGFADRSLASSNIASRALGRAARGLGSSIDDSKLLGDKQARERLAKEEKGFGSGLSLQERLDYLKKNKDTGSERIQARVSGLRASMATDKGQMDELLQSNPDQAREIMNDAVKHYESTGDDASAKKLQDRMSRDLRLQHGDAGAMQTALEKMDSRDLRRLDTSNFQDANFRQAMRSSGILNDLKASNPEARKGFNKAFLAGVDQAHGSKGIDELEAKRFQAEQDRIADNLKGEAAKQATAKNDAMSKLMNAHAAGSLADAFKSGLRFEDIDVTMAPDDDFKRELSKALSDAMVESGSAESVHSLMAARRGDSGYNADQKQRAQGVLDMLEGNNPDGINLIQQIDSAAAGGNLSAAQVRAWRSHSAIRNGSVAGKGDLSAYHVDAGRTFATEGDRRTFRADIASNPSMLLNIQQHLNADDGKNQVAQEVAKAFDKKTLTGLFETFEASRGTASEVMRRQELEKVAEVLEKQLENENLSSELREQVDKAFTHYTRRIKTQM